MKHIKQWLSVYRNQPTISDKNNNNEPMGGARNSTENSGLARKYNFASGMTSRAKVFSCSLLLAGLMFATPAWAGSEEDSAGEQADALIAQMTLSEKLSFTFTEFFCVSDIPGVPRLGIPLLGETDSPNGVRSAGCPGNPNYPGPSTTQLPSSIALAATFDPDIAKSYGNVIGQEIRDLGLSMNWGGDVNLVRDPRAGRTFETMGEDPVLAGKTVANEVNAIQANGVIAENKHLVLNDQESNRFSISANISERAMRESDLLPFEIGVKEGSVLSIMCSYNQINGVYACSNNHIMNDIVKGEWGFPGLIISDFAAEQSVTDANAGVDMDLFSGIFQFQLEAAIPDVVPLSRLDNMVHRTLRSMIKEDLLNNPPIPKLIDRQAHETIAQTVAEQSSVLLKNSNHLLPFDPNHINSIAVIGSNADIAVASGGGSGHVDPVGGNAPVPPTVTTDATYTSWCNDIDPIFCMYWTPSSPLNAIKTIAPHAVVSFDSGLNPATAAALAKNSQVAIVFVHQWAGESNDSFTLSADSGFLGLPCSSLSSPCVDQDQLVAQVAAANPKTIVVIESGSAMLMPWVNNVGAILDVWYPGIKGGEATANLLFGKVNPSGKLPITFPASEADLPRPLSPAATQCPEIFFCANPTPENSTVDYNIEGQNVGYKWFDSQHKPVLFPFGYGLSYTTFDYSKLVTTPVVTDGNKPIRVSFWLKNTGDRAGAEVAQVYLGLPASAGEAPKRYVGSQKVYLQPGEKQKITVTIDPTSSSHPLSFWDGAWKIADGQYQVYVGSSSRQILLNDVVTIHHNGN